MLLLEGSDFLVSERANFDFNFETGSVLVFDVLAAAETLELAVDHDAHLGAQGFGLFHRVGR